MLTQRQSETLGFIERRLKRTGMAPTLEEICRALQLRSVATAHKHLAHLQRKGFIVRAANQPRGIVVIQESRRNGKAWIYCDRDHAPVLHQEDECPVCQFVDAAAMI